jgi:DNA polymerase-3 subunit gamma/tau
MGRALYRKYRSKKLSEIVGQDHITQTLERAIKSGRISHAYLFTGPRGVGKTSIARILAHEVNGLPYSDESIHMDIIEIDAASNRRIDEIRDLRDKVHIAPTSAKYKVYIIDEVHMLTKEAFNALLKTLEEPPAHVIFILATTEAHKLPETIVSRTQRFSFKPIGSGEARDHLREIAAKEGIEIDDEALELLAEHGGGSFRDSISLLDQMSNTGKKSVGKQDVESLLGIAPLAAITALLDAVLQKTPAEIVNSLLSLREQGITPAQIARQLGEQVRSGLLGRTLELPTETALTLLELLMTVQASPNPEARLELVLLKINLMTGEEQPAAQTAARTAPVTRPTVVAAAPTTHESTRPAAPARDTAETPAALAEPAQKPAASEAKAVAGTPANEIAEAATTEEVTIKASPLVPAKSTSAPTSLEWWPQVLTSIKEHNNTLYGVLRMAEPELDGSDLTLKFAFHQKRISEAKNKAKITECIALVTGSELTVLCVLDQSLKGRADTVSIESVAVPVPASSVENTPAAPAVTGMAAPAGNDTLQAITNIFGGGEVLDT